MKKWLKFFYALVCVEIAILVILHLIDWVLLQRQLRDVYMDYYNYAFKYVKAICLIIIIEGIIFRGFYRTNIATKEELRKAENAFEMPVTVANILLILINAANNPLQLEHGTDLYWYYYTPSMKMIIYPVLCINAFCFIIRKRDQYDDFLEWRKNNRT